MSIAQNSRTRLQQRLATVDKRRTGKDPPITTEFYNDPLGAVGTLFEDVAAAISSEEDLSPSIQTLISLFTDVLVELRVMTHIASSTLGSRDDLELLRREAYTDSSIVAELRVLNSIFSSTLGNRDDVDQLRQALSIF